MKKIYALLYLCLAFGFTNSVFAQTGDYPAGVIRWRESRNRLFISPETTPITDDKNFKLFQGLKWYEIDLNYRVTAKFTRTPNEKKFAAPTFGHSKTIDIVKYGTLNFVLQGQEFTLSAYKILRLEKTDPNYLFIPFTDLTNGNVTYLGGRYIDYTIPNSDTVTVDFNQAYNPDVAYDASHICPIPPSENRLPIRVEAGEKLF